MRTPRVARTGDAEKRPSETRTGYGPKAGPGSCVSWEVPVPSLSLALLLAFAFSFRVAHAEDGPVPVDLSVDELWVHAGETRVVPGGTRILAANGAAILGRLVARGEGGVTIVVVLGDLVLDGAIEARTVALEARSGNVRVGSRFAIPPAAEVRVAAAAGAILFAPRAAGASEPFPPAAELLSFHATTPPPGADETEITGR
jgi:hypothetical protein